MTKLEQANFFIHNLHDINKLNICAFSGGKDSIVLYNLCKLSGLPFQYIYSNTTIDPPGHLSFIRKNFPNVIIVQPKLSFFKLIEKKGLPTRFRRFCCFDLKETIGKNAKVFEGVRMDESNSRKSRLSLLSVPEVCDYKIKNKIHVYPLINWSSTDIWDYIHSHRLIYPSLYDNGFTRLGCIGCPLAYKNTRIKEFKLFPKYAFAIIKAIKVNISNGGVLSKYFSDEYSAFYWWISVKSIKSHNNSGLFPIDHKKYIIELLS